jgi:hypothetical protein
MPFHYQLVIKRLGEDADESFDNEEAIEGACQHKKHTHTHTHTRHSWKSCDDEKTDARDKLCR